MCDSEEVNAAHGENAMTLDSRVSSKAFELQQSGNEDLSVDDLELTAKLYANKSEKYEISDGKIAFSSLESRNQFAAQYVFDRVYYTLSDNPILLFQEAQKLWIKEISHHDKSSGRFIALGSKIIDPLDVALQCLSCGWNVFTVLHIIEAALPYLDSLDVELLIRIYRNKHEATKNDFAGALFDEHIQKWLSRFLDVAESLCKRLDDEVDEETAGLFADGVLAIAENDLDKALSLIDIDFDGQYSIKQGVCCFLLGRMIILENAASENVENIEILLRTILAKSEGGLKDQVILSVTNIMHKTTVFDDVVMQLSEAENIQALVGVIRAFYLHNKDMLSRRDISDWVGLFSAIPPEYSGVLDDIDSILSNMFDDKEKRREVVDFLTNWAARHGKQYSIDCSVAKHFDRVVEKLVDNEDILSSLITKWMLSDDITLSRHCAGILSEISIRKKVDVKYDEAFLSNISCQDMLFLVRRTLGFVINRQQLMSLVLSLLKIDSQYIDRYQVVGSLLIGELGYDYPGSTIESCRKMAEMEIDGEVKDFLLRVAEELDDKLKVYDQLRIVNDLFPSSKIQREFVRARARQMGRSFEEASKESIFRQIATEISIKAGSSTFQYFNGMYGSSMQLQSFSTSVEIPKREVLDPVGNAIKLLTLRNVRRN